MDQVSFNSNYVTAEPSGFDGETSDTEGSEPQDGTVAPRNPNANYVTGQGDDRESGTGGGQSAEGGDDTEYEAQINFVATAGGNGFSYPISVELVEKGSSELDQSIAENEPDGNGSSALDQAIVQNEPEGGGSSTLDRAIVDNAPEGYASTGDHADGGYVQGQGQYRQANDVSDDGGTGDGAGWMPQQLRSGNDQQTVAVQGDGQSGVRGTEQGSAQGSGQGTGQNNAQGTGQDSGAGQSNVATGTGGSAGESGGPRTLDPGRFPPAPHDPALVEKGRAYVNALKGGEPPLPPGRAAEILADGVFLQTIGTLLGDAGESDLRAVAVLITDINGAGGPADRYLSNLVLDGAISLGEFHELANDTDFITARLVPHFPDVEARDPASPEANMEVLLRLGGVEQPDGTVYALGEDGLPISEGEEIEESGSSVSGSSPTTIAQPEELSEEAITTAHNVTLGGHAFPEELQQRLNAARSDGGQPDPLLARAAEVFGGTVTASPVEQFLAQSYLRGLIPLDDYIARVNDPAFLDDPAAAVAAETMLGTAPDHGPADDFMNTIYLQGHIDLDTFITEVNDEAKMADLAAAAESGVVNYTSAGFGDLDALIDGLDLSEDGLRAILHPGVNLNDGPPSPEQIAAFHHLAGGSDQNFVELVTTWLLNHNPGYSIQFGHPTPETKEAGEPRSFFWADNGQKVDDPFLDSLLVGLHARDDKLDVATGHGIVNAAHPEHDGFVGKQIEKAVDEDINSEGRPLSFEVRIAYEGVTGEGKDEMTDTSRWLDDIIYPDGELEDRLAAIGGIPIDLDDNFDGEYVSGTGGRARQAFEAIDPTLTDGVQIAWVRGADGVDLQNASRLEKTVLYIEESNGVTFEGNDGPVDAYVYGSDFQYETGSGNAPVIQMERPIVADTARSGTLRLDPGSDVAFLDGIVAAHASDPDTLPLLQSFSQSSPGNPLAAAAASEQGPFGVLTPAGEKLTPEEKGYVYTELVKAIQAEAGAQGGGQTDAQADVQGGTDGGAPQGHPGGAGSPDGVNPTGAQDGQHPGGYRQWVDGHAAGLLQMSGGNLLGERDGPSVIGLLRQERLPDGTPLTDTDRQAIYDSAEGMLVASGGQSPAPGSPVPGSEGTSPHVGADPLVIGGSAASEPLADPSLATGGEGVPDARHAEVDDYVVALIEEAIGAVNAGQLNAEAVPAIVHAMLDESAAPGTIELTPDELAYAHAHADTLLFGPDPSSHPQQTTAATPDTGDPYVTATGERPADTVERSGVSGKTAGPTDAVTAAPSGGYVPYTPPTATLPTGEDVAWDALAEEALTRYTVTVDGAPRFDDEAFFSALYDDPTLLEWLGPDALDYIGARTIELAIRTDVDPVSDALA